MTVDVYTINVDFIENAPWSESGQYLLKCAEANDGKIGIVRGRQCVVMHEDCSGCTDVKSWCAKLLVKGGLINFHKTKEVE